MATRLDRLVLLLDTGSTPAVRTTAAKQLGDIQRQHPDDLYHLLARVLVHLRSSNWETRTAAGQAVEAIARNVPLWDPPPIPPSGADAPVIDPQDDDGLYSFATFDIENVMRNGAPLLASAGTEYNVDMGLEDMDPKERMAKQKKMLKQQLGLDFMDVDFLGETDLASASQPAARPQQQQQQAQDVMRSSVKVQPVKEEPSADISMEGLSARERNVLKRKARLAAKDKGKEKVRVVDITSSFAAKKRQSMHESDQTTSNPSSTPPTTPHKPIPTAIKMDQQPSPLESPTTSEPPTEDSKDSKVVIDPSKVKPDESATETRSLTLQTTGSEWPFEGLCEQLCLDLFHPKWTTRHGAAIALREIIKIHACGAGKLVGVSKEENGKRNKKWMEDVGIHFLCVLGLDRFADFVGDQAVSPVRETVAQALGALMRWCDKELCVKVLEEGLLKLVDGVGGQGNGKIENAGTNEQWQVRHGGLVGLKYWMAVREDLVGGVVGDGQTRVFRAIVNGLKDRTDEIRYVSSTTLLPIVPTLLSLLPTETIFREIVSTLWNALTDLDDLTAATSSVMDLLSQLSQHPKVADVMRDETQRKKLLNGQGLGDLITRLFPFFRHAIPAVRSACIRMVGVLCSVETVSSTRSNTPVITWITPTLLSLLFQNFLLEERADIIASTLEVWKSLITLLESRSPTTLQSLLTTSTPTSPLTTWYGLILTPLGYKLDLRLFHQYTTTATTKSEEGLNVSPHDKAMATQDLTVVSKSDVIRGRIAGARAVGILCGVLIHLETDSTVSKEIHSRTVAFLNSGWVGQRAFVAIIVEEIFALFADRTTSNTHTPFTKPFLTETWDLMNQMISQWDSGVTAFYVELWNALEGVRNECVGLMSQFESYGIKGPAIPLVQRGGEQQQQTSQQQQQEVSFSVQVADQCVGQIYEQMIAQVASLGIEKSRGKKDPLVVLSDRQKRVVATIESYKNLSMGIESQAMASIACALVRLNKLPAKLTPIIRALMEGTKTEPDESMQERAARGVATLVGLLIQSGKVGAADKVVKNLGVGICGVVPEDKGLVEGIESMK
ncbi:btaf1 RNA polymerase II, B-TFIID transcription factor-associated, 170kDa, partial [Rhizophlyctis rosea]